MTHETLATELVETYLARLRTAVADLPESTRTELLDNIGTHLAETAPPDADEATVRQALDELGNPDEIAAAARAETGPTVREAPPAHSSGGGAAYDAITVVVLSVGGLAVPIAGWLAGVVLLWAGPRWRVSEKIVGTLAWPLTVALVVLAWALGFRSPYGLLAALVLVLVVVAAAVVVFTALLRRARARA